METLQYATKTKAIKEHKCDFCALPIEKGSVYLKSVHKLDGDIYDWKTHQHCQLLASKLKWYDDWDEGLTDEIFQESLRYEYQRTMQQTQPELYESKEFKYPSFNGIK